MGVRGKNAHGKREVGGTESKACAREVKFEPKLQLFVMSAVGARRISLSRRGLETAGRGRG